MNQFHPLTLDRRARVARWVLALTVATLVVAFFRTQILSHGKYQLQSENNRLRAISIPAPRGVITDRNGSIIAENVPGYTVALLPDDSIGLRETLERIAPIVNLDSAEREHVMQRYRRAPYLPAMVLADAPFSVVSALEERRLVIPGLVIQSEPKRSYPDSDIVSHLVGDVGEVTDADLAQSRYAALHPGALVGKDGLEREYDDSLRGSDGLRFVEVNALGHVVREEGAAPALPPVAGATIQTTIDLDLQRYVSRIFPAGQRGAVIAMNPNTGEILALYSAPGFDPNAFVGGVQADYWRTLNQSETHPLLDRAIQARYPPGSTWKLAIAAMALKRGIVTMHSHMPIPCRGGMQYYNRYFHCWQAAPGHGDLTLAEAIAQSCDVYFYQLGLKLGLTTLLEDANGWGFRSRTGIDLPGEVTPEFPSGTEYYDRLYGPRRWTSAVTLNLAVGQGENAQTLVDMVRFYQMLASDGKSRTPYLVRPASQSDISLGLTPDQLAGLRQAMISVVESGTARGARLGSITIAGKTGTAQNPHGPNHGWFIGFAPADKPEIVVGAIVEFAREGPYVAPLVARTIARYLGVDTTAIPAFQMTLPADTAPRELQILPGFPRDSTDTGAVAHPRTR
ncbi:MAG TPA: penicillin-binding protein 2 [Gemmatimonadales bacterium]|nr:penicillin-binding protein 2 [Gemmatimonadales bacterium]